MIILKFEDSKIVKVQGVMAFTSEELAENLKQLGHPAEREEYNYLYLFADHLNLDCGLWLLVIDKLSPDKEFRVKEKQFIDIKQEEGHKSIKLFRYSAIFDDVIRCVVI